MKTKKTMFGMLLFLLLAIPFATAQETADETVVIQGGEDYPVMSRAMDRIKLAFTFNAEKKLEVMNKIEQRREDHYNFLLANGKTEQAARFMERTTGLERNFDQWKAKREESIARIEGNAEEVRERSDVERREAAQRPEEAGRARS